MCVSEMGKSVLVRCLFFHFGLGARASNGENLATGRGVERLKKLCALLDKNGNARLGLWTRRLQLPCFDLGGGDYSDDDDGWDDDDDNKEGESIKSAM